MKDKQEADVNTRKTVLDPEYWRKIAQEADETTNILRKEKEKKREEIKNMTFFKRIYTNITEYKFYSFLILLVLIYFIIVIALAVQNAKYFIKYYEYKEEKNKKINNKYVLEDGDIHLKNMGLSILPLIIIFFVLVIIIVVFYYLYETFKNDFFEKLAVLSILCLFIIFIYLISLSMYIAFTNKANYNIKLLDPIRGDPIRDEYGNKINEYDDYYKKKGGEYVSSKTIINTQIAYIALTATKSSLLFGFFVIGSS